MLSSGWQMYSYLRKSNRKNPINKFQSIIFCRRTRHLPLNSHLKRIHVKTSAACLLCNHPDENAEHHLFDCINLKELWGRFLPANPNILKCLYGSTEQMKKTCSFLNLASSDRCESPCIIYTINCHLSPKNWLTILKNCPLGPWGSWNACYLLPLF